MGVQARNVQQRDVSIHTGLCIDITSLSEIDSPEYVLAVLVLVSRERVDDVISLISRIRSFTRCEIRIDKLRLPVRPEYDSRGEGVSRVVDRHAGKVCKDLSGDEVTLQMIEDRLGCQDIVVAVLSDLRPHLLWDRLVPGKAELLVMDTQLDLPLLEALLLGGEVVHIRIGQVVCLAEKRVAAALDDDPLRQIVQLLVGISHETGIEHVVVIPAAVETNKPELKQLLDLRRLRIDHPDDRLALTLDLPVDQEKVREDLHVVEYEFRVVVFDVLRCLLGLERHLVDQFDAVVCLMGAACSEGQDGVPHVRHVIRDTAAIGLLENLIDEVDARLRVGMILAVEILLDHRPEHLLILNTFEVHHLFVSFQWQPRADRCDRQVVAFCQFSAQRALACENFHFDLVVIDTGELLRIPCVNIMQVDACS